MEACIRAEIAKKDRALPQGIIEQKKLIPFL